MARRALAVALALGACGPSVSAVYEANIRFEHCYRLDLDTRVAPGHRLMCWREWTERYTYGQTRDRLEHARRRIAALESGDTSRPVLDLSGGDAGGGPTESPAPTSAHAPPPPVAPATPPPEDAGAAEGGVADKPDAGTPEPPGVACVADCRQAWQSCQGRCVPDAGARRGGCKACDADYGRCVQRCYR